jgi:uncharacterized repeat protein (TIGR01451 family)
MKPNKIFQTSKETQLKSFFVVVLTIALFLIGSTQLSILNINSIAAGEGIELIKSSKIKDVDGNGITTPNDLIIYTMTIKNTGTVPLTNVTLTDIACTGGVTGGPIATLAVGAVDSTTFICSRIIRASNILSGLPFSNSATVSATGPTGTIITDISDSPDTTLPGQDDPTITPIERVPRLELNKAATYVDTNGNGKKDAGDTINYAFEIKNTGNLPLDKVTLTDPLPGLVLTGAPILKMLIGTTNATTYSATYTITAADVTAGKVENQAKVESNTFPGDLPPYSAVDTSNDPATTTPNDPTIVLLETLPTPIGKIELLKFSTLLDTNANGYSDVGDTINYTFTVKNTGATDLTAVTLTDSKCSPIVGGPVATLAIGASDTTTFSCKYVLTAADITAGKVDNTATVSGKDPSGKVVSDISDSNDATKTGLDDPTVTLLTPKAIDDIRETAINTPITYSPIANDIIPTGSKITSINGITVVAGTPIIVTGGTVLVNADGTVTATPTPGSTATITFPYEVTTPAGVKVTANDTITIVAAVDDTNTTPLNTPVTYAPLANDKVPTGSKITSIDGKPVTVGTPIPVTNGTVTVNADGTIIVTPNNGYVGDIKFPYDVTTPTGTKVTANDTVTITGTASIELTKTSTLVDTNNNGYTDLGDKLKYVFSVKNTGPLVVSNIVITDNKCSPVTNSPIASLAIAATNATPTCDYTITAADVLAGKVENTAKAAGTDPAGKPVTDISDDGNDPSKLGKDDPTISLLVPKAIDDAKETGINTPITYSPLANDIVPIDSKITSINGLPVVVGTPIPVTGGTITVNADGTVTATPTPGSTATITFPYEVTTPAGVKVTANDTITIVAAVDDNKTTTINTPITYNPVTENDKVPTGSKITSIDGKPVTVGTLITVTNGSVTVNADGTVTVTPNPGYTGTITFPYEVTTPTGTKVTAIDTITVPGVGSIELLKFSTLVDTNTNGYSDVVDSINYTFTVKNSGSTALTDVTITDSKCSPVLGGPIATLATAASDTTTFSCKYTLTAADIATGKVDNTATVTAKDPTGKVVKDISDSNDPVKTGLDDPTVTLLTPKAIDDIKETGINTQITYSPLTNDIVPTGSKITSINGVPVVIGTPIPVTGGTVTVNADGTVTATPTTGSTETITFSYEVTTPAGIKVTANDTITIVALVDDTKTTNVNTPVTYDPLVNDSVPTGSKITAIDGKPVVIGTPIVVPNGTVTVNADGTVTVTPDTGFVGAIKFPYEVTTPTGTKVTAIDTVTIIGTGSVELDKAGTFKDENGDGAAQVGETITYKFTVFNTGTVPLTNIKITDPKLVSPFGAVLGGPIANLAPGLSDTTTFTGFYIITQADINTGQFINTATVTAEEESGKVISNTSNDPKTTAPADPTVVPLIQAPKLELDKTGTLVDTNADGESQAGETIKYTFTVRNTGNVALTAVTVTDNVCSQVTGGPIATLAVAAVDTTTFTCTYTLTAADITAGKVINTATATGKDPKGNSVTATSNDPKTTTPGDPTVTPLLPAIPKLVDDNNTTPVNTPITYAPLANDKIPVGSLITAIDGKPVTVGAPIPVLNGTVTVNADGTITVTPNPGFTGVITFPYEVTTPSGVKVTAIDTVTVTGTGAIEIIKSSTLVDTNANGYTDLGDKLVYKFLVKNTGPLTLTNVIITDSKCSPIVGSPIATLAVGASNNSATCDYAITALDIDLGKVENTAKVTGTDPTGKPVTDTSDDGNDPSKPGLDDPTISLLVPKAFDDVKSTPLDTPVTYNPITENDKVPAGSKITAIDGKPVVIGTPIQVPNGTVTVNADGTIIVKPNPGFVGDIKFPYEVTTPTGVKVTANDTVTIIGVGGIEINKSSTLVDTNANGYTDIGDKLVYKFVVKNTGSLLLTNVTITDSKCSPITGSPIASLAVAASNSSATCDYLITEADIAIGKVENTAIATGTTPDGKTVTDTSDDGNDTSKPGLDDPTISILTPKAFDDTKSTPFDTPITYNPLENDKVPAGSKITAIDGKPVVIGTPIPVLNGTVTVNADGTVTVKPNPGYVGTITFPYEVTTPNGTKVTATDTITIIGEGKIEIIKSSTLVDTNLNGYTDAGDKLTYKFTVNNTGNVVLTNVTITDSKCSPIAFSPIASLEVAATNSSATCDYSITEADVMLGKVENTAIATGTTPDGKVVKDTSDDGNDPSKPGQDDPTISLLTPKAVDDTRVTPYNTPVTYSPLGNDIVPANSTITAINGMPVTVGTPIKVTNGTVILNLDGTVTVTPDINYTGTISFPYEVTTSTGIKVTANDTVTVNGKGAIELDKAVTYIDANNDGKLNLGETVKYAFTIRNTGSTILTNVSVTDPMPGIVIIGTPIASLPIGGVNTTAYTATYIVTQADLDKGVIINQATVNSYDPSGAMVKDISNDPNTTYAKDPTQILIPKVIPPVIIPEPIVCPTCPQVTPTCSNCNNPCAGNSNCTNSCNNGCCTKINSISGVTNTNTVTITGGQAPMLSPVYNYNNVFNSNVNFTQGPITFDFSPVVNNYYR